MSAEMTRVPADTVVLPEKVFVPESVREPAPDFVSAPVDEITELTVADSDDATVIAAPVPDSAMGSPMLSVLPIASVPAVSIVVPWPAAAPPRALALVTLKVPADTVVVPV